MKKILVLLVLMVAMSVIAADWHIPARYSGLQDSVILILMTQAGDTMSVDTMAAGQYYDTTLSVSNDTAYYAVFLNWAQGEDSCATWSWARSASGTNSGFTIGTYTHWVALTDSSGGDTSLASIKVTAYNSSGGLVDWGISNGSGDVHFSLDSGSYTFKMFDHGYASDTIVDTVITDNDTTAMEAYDTDDGNTARLWGTLVDAFGDSLYGATIVAHRDDCETATANNLVVSPDAISADTDTDGYFYLDLIKSDEFDETKCGFYTIVASFGGEQVFQTRALWVTGGFNIADSIASR